MLIEALAGLEGPWQLRVVGTGESQQDCEELARRLGTSLLLLRVADLTWLRFGENMAALAYASAPTS